MGILDKIMFWKKTDEFSELGLGDKENLAFGDEFGLSQQPTTPQGIGQPQSPPSSGLPTQPTYQQPSAFQQQYQPSAAQSPQQDMNSKNLELISSKIDALKASLDNINQRLANIEALARGEEDNKRKRYY